MPRYKELKGEKFGELTVKRLSHIKKYNNRSKAFWECLCDCGKETTVTTWNLTSGKTKSCGCLLSRSKKGKKPHNYAHGDTKTRLYGIWCNMKNRCNNPNVESYKRYGAVGIRVCDEWDGDYESFKKWAIATGYNDELTIDRINNEKGYDPDNCRWATTKEQANNKRNNVKISINGVEKTIGQWSETSGLDISVIRNRYKRGDKGERLLRPVAKGGV